MQGDKKWARIDIFFQRFSLFLDYGCTNLTLCFFKDLRKEKKTVALKFWRSILTDFLYASIHVFLSMGHGIEEPDFIQYNNNKSFIDEDFSYDFQS